MPISERNIKDLKKEGVAEFSPPKSMLEAKDMLYEEYYKLLHSREMGTDSEGNTLYVDERIADLKMKAYLKRLKENFKKKFSDFTILDPSKEDPKYKEWDILSTFIREMKFFLDVRGAVYAGQTIIGGNNYVEAQIRLSDDAVSRDNEYKNDDWSKPNTVAFVRYDDRMDSYGRPILFIQDMGSRWAQEDKNSPHHDDWINLVFDYLKEVAVQRGATAIAWATGDQVEATFREYDKKYPRQQVTADEEISLAKRNAGENPDRIKECLNIQRWFRLTEPRSLPPAVGMSPQEFYNHVLPQTARKYFDSGQIKQETIRGLSTPESPKGNPIQTWVMPVKLGIEGQKGFKFAA